jgi:hypothetical protein
MNEVRKERTDWRDSGLIRFHERFFYTVPSDNTEFLMVEYDKSTPVAIVDYRLKNRLIKGYSNSVRLLCDSEKINLPYFSCEYEIGNNRINKIFITPFNIKANAIFNGENEFTEKDYVIKLYDIRETIVKGRRTQGVTQARILRDNIFSFSEKWNGEILSKRHREWGWDCPVVDLDFLVYKKSKIKAIIEFKHRKSYLSPKSFKFHPTGKTLSWLANNYSPRIPLLIVYYEEDFSVFRIYPITEGWSKYDPYFGVDLNSEMYLRFLNSL